HWSITNEARRLMTRYSVGETDLRFTTGARFHPKHFYAGKLTPKRIQQGIQFNDQYYIVRRQGYSLVYVDIDDHLAFQRDKPQLTQDVLTILGRDNFFVSNDRRLYLKVYWGDVTFPEFQAAYQEFRDALYLWSKSKGYDSDIDVP